MDRLKAVASLLYGGASVFLSRKKERADEILLWERAQRDWSWLTKEKLLRLRAEHSTWKRVAESLGLTRSNLLPIRRRNGL